MCEGTRGATVIPRASVRGVVLAGGESTRFGESDKALADLAGRPLVAHVVDAVSDATDEPPLLAVADDREGERLAGALARPVDAVVDVPTHEGPAAGLFAATAATDAEWLFVCGCDMPLVAPAGVDALRRAVDDAGSNGGAADADATPSIAAVVPTVDGHDQPLHALYRREAVGEVRDDVPVRGGPMALLDALDPVRRVPAAAFDAPVAAGVTNVNTPGDLERLERRDVDG